MLLYFLCMDLYSFVCLYGFACFCAGVVVCLHGFVHVLVYVFALRFIGSCMDLYVFRA